jgi:hypothetical protein
MLPVIRIGWTVCIWVLTFCLDVSLPVCLR